MKIAPIIDALKATQSRGSCLNYRLIHTGQHYDQAMSGDFFEQLGIPKPDINLEVGSGTQAEQTAAIMVRYEKVLLEQRSDLCLVVTDSIANWFFTTSETANANLCHSGVTDDRIFFVGNTMIDTLLKQMPHLRPPTFWNELGLQPKRYFVVTLHRPANVDGEQQLVRLLHAIADGTGGLPVVFPVHPRTAKSLRELEWQMPDMCYVDPQGYLEFNCLVKHAKGMITDSGRITEETTVMGVPCMTLRNNTERPETVSIGTNELIGTDPVNLGPALKRLMEGRWKKGAIPEKWDGQSAVRIVAELERLLA
jgi:UDP-N-acetylglucosamine 2-epimerase (non-hydrolysing)